MTALNSTLFHELNAALRSFSSDDSVRCVVLTGSEKAFAAGADIKEMKDKQFAEVYKGDFLAHWTELSQFRKPIVAAVSGYAVSLFLPSFLGAVRALLYGTHPPLSLGHHDRTARRRLRIGYDVRTSALCFLLCAK